MAWAEKRDERFVGMLLGAAMGDSVGLPVEGLSPRRAFLMYRGRWEQQFLLGMGMVSDDTEHAIFVAQSLLAHPSSAIRFTRSLSWKFRWWLLGIPAGIGWATLRSTLKLWMGVPPSRSGAASAGNGAVIRGLVIGAYFSKEPEKLRDYTILSTRMTHTDPRAATGALALARLAAFAMETRSEEELDPARVMTIMQETESEDAKWLALIESMKAAQGMKLTTEEFAIRLRLNHGVSGFVYHTVVVAVYAWIRNLGDFRKTVISVLNCGGDTDSVAAIAGALAGIYSGGKDIPQRWLMGLCEFPRSVSFMKLLGTRLGETSTGLKSGPVTYFWPLVPVRNLLFLLGVLFHVCRRMLPPY